MITVDNVQTDKVTAYLGAIPGATERALSAALNRSAMEAREQAITSITNRYAIDGSVVRDKITVERATPTKLAIVVRARSTPLAMTAFPHAPTASGTGGKGQPVLRAEIIRGEAKDVPGAFIAPINGKNRVMFRTGKKTSSGRDGIKVVPSVPIAKMMGVPVVSASIEERALGMLEAHLDAAIDRELKRVTP